MVCPQLIGQLQAAVVKVDHDGHAWALKSACHQGGQTDRSGADDSNCIRGSNASADDATLVAGSQDIRQEEDVDVPQLLRNFVQTRIGDRHTGIRGMEAVDQVSEYPAAAVQALAVRLTAAVRANPTRSDRRNDHAVSFVELRDGVARLLDDSHRLVPKYCAGLHLGDVSLKDVQIRSANGRRCDAGDDVCGGLHFRIRDVLESTVAGAVVNNCSHVGLLSPGYAVFPVSNFRNLSKQLLMDN